MITQVARVLIYSLMSFEWLVLAFLCFVAYREMQKPYHKKLLWWLVATSIFKILGYAFSALTAIPTPFLPADTFALAARTAFGICLIPFGITIYQVYLHIEYTRHKEDHEEHLAE